MKRHDVETCAKTKGSLTSPSRVAKQLTNKSGVLHDNTSERSVDCFRGGKVDVTFHTLAQSSIQVPAPDIPTINLGEKAREMTRMQLTAAEVQPIMVMSDKMVFTTQAGYSHPERWFLECVPSDASTCLLNGVPGCQNHDNVYTIRTHLK